MNDILGLPVILLGAFNGVFVTLQLLVRKKLTPATAVLCGFICLLLLRLVIYTLGVESVFDPHSWLYVPPLEVSLAYGPCIFLFITWQTQRNFQAKDLLHFFPVTLQITYYISLLLLPNAMLNDWVMNVHLAWLNKAEVLLVGVSLSIYVWTSRQRLKTYKSWLQQRYSDTDNYCLDWPVAFIVLTGVFAVVWSVFSVLQIWITPGYDFHFGLFAIQSIMLTFIALETWSSSGLQFPLQLQPHNPAAIGTIQINYVREKKPENRDTEKLQEIYTNCVCQLERCEWWKEPQLTLMQLASRLGTNTTTLSNAINVVREENFNQFINAIRVRHVCDALSSSDNQKSLLQLGIDAGFNSKNSFNRNFKQITGETPSAYKRRIATDGPMSTKS